MVIVDTSVWIDLLQGKTTSHASWLEAAIRNYQEIGLTSLVLCEVLQGARTDGRFSEFRRDLLRFPIFDTGSAELAISAAQNYRILRTRGITVRRTIDCLIATFCIDFGHQLLHCDGDFHHFESHLGLQVIHPPAITLN